MSNSVLESGDSPELEALFYSIVNPSTAGNGDHPSATVLPGQDEQQSAMYSDLGQMVRWLHDALQTLGYDRMLGLVAESIPDAKDRLSYIATLTENAAERVLNATDMTRPLQEELGAHANALSSRWEQLYAGQLSVEEFKQLAGETRQYLQHVPSQTQGTKHQLLDIVMAQEFQDLTGQVIKKIMAMVLSLERGLLNFLVEHSPPQTQQQLGSNPFGCQLVHAEHDDQVAASQQQVDDLLESLGF